MNSACFEKSAGYQTFAHLRFQIVGTIGFARRREPASIRSRNFFHAVGTHNLFDQIDIPLKITAITWDLPLHVFGGADFLQTESFKDLIDGSRFDRDADHSVAPVVI